MKKILAFFLTVLTFLSCKSTLEVVEHSTNYSTLVGNEKFRGVIFLESANCFMCLQDKNRFSPTIEEIRKTEEILERKLKLANKPLINQGHGCPIIHKNLNNYRRQYFGYTDDNNNKIIYVTFNWDKYTLFNRLQGIEKDKSKKWKRELQNVLDGCSNHWEIKVNLKKEALFDLEINGSA